MQMAGSNATTSGGVIVTGGCSGIGEACAEVLAAEGRPVAIWDLDERRAAVVAQRLATQHGVATVGIGIDLRQVEGIAQAVERTRAAMGTIGALVHAAGVSHAVTLNELTPGDWDAVLNVNLRALPFIVQAIRADLAAAKNGAVVGIASINATLGNAANPAYTASKGGMLSLVRSLADELAIDGVRINAVSPGQIRTPMLQPALDALPSGAFERRILLGRLGEPLEIARAVRFLLSADASYITAAQLVVDGGNISSQRM